MWAKEQVLKVLTKDAKNEYIMIDITIVKAHQQTTRVKKRLSRLWGTPEVD